MTSGEILVDIRMRLEGMPESVLHGDNGLAAATMRALRFREMQVELMREALAKIQKLAHDGAGTGFQRNAILTTIELIVCDLLK